MRLTFSYFDIIWATLYSQPLILDRILLIWGDSWSKLLISFRHLHRLLLIDPAISMSPTTTQAYW